MKIIDSSPAAQNVTYLPQEVLELIFARICTNRSSAVAQKDLWSCSLVCRSWYTSSIKHLYKAPILSSRNFSEFAKTLSPPVASRTRRIGLEDLVQHLNMGSLAYESKKSTTSRLIGRTKSSLQSFVAPAVSFSTSCLAPLSKCNQLYHLDLSRDVYDFNLARLMHSVRTLPKLTWLSLPKTCHPFETDSTNSLMNKRGENFWPVSLVYLQFNDTHLEPSANAWTTLLKSLPPHLTSLSFRNLAVYDTFDTIAQAEAEVPQVISLSIGVHRSDDTYYLNHICRPFPNITQMVIPAMTSWILKNFLFVSHGSTWSLNSAPQQGIKPPQELKLLVLEESPDFPTSNHIRLSDLNQFVESCPKLLRIEVPEAYLSIDENEDAALDKLNTKLAERFEGLESGNKEFSMQSVGIFTTERRENAGVGLKRSFRYRGEG